MRRPYTGTIWRKTRPCMPALGRPDMLLLSDLPCACGLSFLSILSLVHITWCLLTSCESISACDYSCNYFHWYTTSCYALFVHLGRARHRCDVPTGLLVYCHHHHHHHHHLHHHQHLRSVSLICIWQDSKWMYTRQSRSSIQWKRQYHTLVPFDAKRVLTCPLESIETWDP